MRTLLAWCLLGLACFGCLRSADLPDQWPCATSNDCDGGQVCWRNHCAAKGTCATDAECEAGQACLSGRCAAAQCSSTHAETCGAYACIGYQCQTSCQTEADCAVHQGCSEGACVDANCQAGCGAYACSHAVCVSKCDTNLDCASGNVCVGGACQPPPKATGETCSENAECVSQVCCLSGADPQARCATSCKRAENGQPCSQSLQCTSLSCVKDTCVACADAVCTKQHCGDAECGQVDGLDCGACLTGARCDANHCVPACVDMDCGYDGPVYCGSCADRTACMDNKCQEVCQGFDCGLDRGALCGSCALKSYCDPKQQCVLDCDGRECGASPKGADCGTCAGKNYCDLAGQCQPACDGYVCGSPNGISCGTCADGLLCGDGACITPVCDPLYASFCKDGQPYLCHGGISAEAATPCDADAFCVESFDPDDVRHSGAACMLKPCAPGEKYCTDTQAYADCDDLGHGPKPGARDCSAEQLSCTNAGCGDVAFDQLLGCDKTATRKVMGNVYAVTKDVVLFRLDQYFASSGSRWLVYDSLAATGPFTKIADVTDWHTTLVDTGGYSPWLNVPLSSGHYYLLAAMAEGGYDTTFCYQTQSTTAVSFGMVLSGGYASDTLPPDTIATVAGLGLAKQNVATVVLK